MKVLITGTHFTPAVATAEELKKKSGIKLVYVGRSTTLEGDPSTSVESQVLPKMGVKFIPIIAGRLQRSFTIYTIPSILKIPIGFIQSLYIVLSEKPDIILSFGGYVSVPVVIAGWLFSIPIIIHEQTLISGLANKISSLFADKIALSFKKKDRIIGKTIITGNPLRSLILNPKELSNNYLKIFNTAKKEKLPVILISCGNQGSHIINLVIEECIDKLVKKACIIHISGDNKFGDFERLEKLQNDHYLVKKWIGDDYGGILSKIDLVLCRAGINTLSELVYMKKPGLVIPIPYIYQDEQNINAKFFKNAGLVKILPQPKLSAKVLQENVKDMLNNLDSLKEKAKGAKKVIIPDAAKRLALEVLLV